MQILPSGIAAQGSFRWQIILAFVVGFFFLAAAFTAYQVKTERAYLYRASSDETLSLAESLAASSLPWVLANDVAGLQEVVHSFQSHPELRYAMIISPSGRVLAHSDATKIGQFLTDEASLTLIKSPPVNTVMIDDESLIDVVAPVMVDHRHVGWARVGQGRERIVGNLQQMMLSSALFVLMAVALSLFAAILIANRLGYRIGALVKVAEAVQAGNYSTRVNIAGEDEVARLANSLNHMLDVLARDEEQLRTASLYTRSLIEASLDPLVTISVEGKITDVNQATEKITGRSRSELIGTDFSDYFTEPDKARDGYLRVFARGSVTDYPLALRHLDGHVTDVLYNASVYRNEAGEVLGVFAAARDITEHKRAEATRAQLADIVESSNDAIIGKSPEGIIVSWNKSAEAIYGYSADEIIGKHITALAPPSLHAEMHKLLEKVRKGGTVVNHESERIRKDGALIHVALTISPIRDASGNITGISTIARDITERKLNEAVNASRLHLVQFSLTHSMDELLEETLNEAEKLTGSVIGFYHFVEDDQISLTLQNWSTSTKAVFCKAEGKGLHYPIDEAGVWADCVRQGKAVIHNDYASLPNRRGLPEGHATVIRELVVPVFRGNKISAILGVGNKPANYTEKDVTTVSLLADLAFEIAERKKAEDKINELNRDLERRVEERTTQLEAANKELESFAYSVSHDLRTPLRAIDGFSRILLDDYTDKLDEEGRRLLNVVRDNTSRMGQLIDDILKFSRTGRVELSFSEIDMQRLAREVFDELQPDNGHLQLEIEAIPKAHGDSAMMRQVFVNLLSNAIKFSRTCETPRIKVGGSIEGDEAVYYVQDNGAGFDMQYADKLFGVFQRLHGVTEFEGTGIGLAIVKRIVTRHGGRVWAEGKVGWGATIHFALPTGEKTHG